MLTKEIKEAKKLIKQGKNQGEVIASGKTIDRIEFLIIKLNDDLGIILQLAYEDGDLLFNENIRVGSECELKMINDSAEWKSIDTKWIKN